MRAWLILILLAAAATSAALRNSAAPPAPTTPTPDPAPAPAVNPAPVYSPAESLGLLQIQPGFRIELFAAEPMVEAPVEMRFDEDGRLWVVEMVGYMPDVEGSGELEPNCRIAVLEDTDGDGKADKRTVFMDKLILPRSVLPCYGGALVLAPPNLIFAKDTDGDGKADQRTVLATGLGGLVNPEHAPNSLTLGLDGWIHLSQCQTEYRFDGKSVITRPTPGHGQWGLAQGKAGRLYYVPNSDTLRVDLFPKHYAARNPEVRSVAGMNELVGKSPEVWPARPTPGVNRGYQPGTLRPDGTLANHTAACSPACYNAELFGEDFQDDVFTCEPAAFMVRRLVPKERNGVFEFANAYSKTEFLTSTDERFRPVNLSVGPDGVLYIADMYRGVIQHRTYVTVYLREQIKSRGLEKPLGMGRIYRVVPEKGTPRARPKLSQATDGDLVKTLADPDAWWRRTAQRLIVERRATGVVGALHEMLAAEDTSWEGGLHALWTLDALGALTPEEAVTEIYGERPGRVPANQCAALRAAERWLENKKVFEAVALKAWGGDFNETVRLQALLSLGELRDDDGLDALWTAAAVLNENDSALMRTAILTGLRGREAAFLRLMINRSKAALSKAELAIAGELAEIVLRQKSAGDHTWVVSLIGGPDPALAAEMLKRLARVQRLDTPKPTVIELDAEPAGWSAVLTDSKSKLNRQARDADAFLTWPGRPAPGRAVAEVRPLNAREQQRFRRGEELFVTAGCTGCHAPSGTGTAGQIPPLVGSARVLGPENRLARILLHGIQGPLFVDGVEYNGIMPPAPVTRDGDVASLMTYIRRSWGNTADPVAVQTVERVRRETRERKYPWRGDELDAVK